MGGQRHTPLPLYLWYPLYSGLHGQQRRSGGINQGLMNYFVTFWYLCTCNKSEGTVYAKTKDINAKSHHKRYWPRVVGDRWQKLPYASINKVLFPVTFRTLNNLLIRTLKFFRGLGLLIPEVSKSHLDTPHSVGLLWMSEQTIAETSTWQHTTLTTDRLTLPQRVSQPQSQQRSGRRPTP
jgi:hypothetical protein